MANPLVITIGRQCGSGGRQVAELLAQKLSLEIYDSNLLDILAQEGGDEKQAMEAHDEKAPGFWNFLKFGSRMESENDITPDSVFLSQSHLIQSLAEKGPCIFIGRAADFILEDRPNTVSVFLTSPVEARAQRKVKMLPIGTDITLAKMQGVLRKMDQTRAKFYKHYTGRTWGHGESYDLIINTGKVGVEGAVELILAFIALQKKA